MAPLGFREYLIRLIRREVEHKNAGRPASIFAKCNSLTDTGLIEELYAASAAGVPITLVIRGVCCLRPAVPGLSENIRVASIVGRFLEHARVYLFANGGSDEIYLSSADLMHRNLNRRVEVMFPIEDPQQRIRARTEFLENAIGDNTKIRWLRPDGTYRTSCARMANRHTVFRKNSWRSIRRRWCRDIVGAVCDHAFSEKARRQPAPTVKSLGMGRVLALVLFVSANCFGQVAAGNDKYEQKQYADAANAYEKVPPNQRTAEIYDRLGISYHLSNQFRAAETAYRNALKLPPENAAVRTISQHSITRSTNSATPNAKSAAPSRRIPKTQLCA